MPNFNFKKIKDQQNDFAKILLTMRLEKGLELGYIAKKISIREEYLKAIENNRLDLLPSGIYQKNFLKRYAEFLDIDPQEIKKQLSKLEENSDDPFSKKVIQRKNLLVFPKIIKIASFVLAISACFLYLVFYTRKIMIPPSLVVTQPQDNLQTKERSVTITGETESEVELKINGESFLSNKNGLFSKKISLKSGLNNISISAKKKYSHENTIIKQILVE